jgi:hypothetical protein
MRRGGIQIIGNGAIPGLKGDIFVPGGSYPPGAVGQYTLLDHPFTYIDDPRSLVDENPDINLLWVAGDGNTPTKGPQMSATGSPTAAESPYQLSSGVAVASEIHTITTNRYTNNPLDPLLSNDVILQIVFRPSRGAANSRYISNRSTTADKGFSLYTINTGTTLVWLVNNGSNIFNLSNIISGSWMHSVFIIDRTNNLLQTWINGQLTDSDSIAGLGSISSSNPLVMMAGDGATGDGDIAFFSLEYGNAVAAKWVADSHAMIKEAAHRFTGVYPAQGLRGSFTRASGASWIDRSGAHRIASSYLPRAGDSEGLLLEPQRQNDCYNIFNPQATTGWSVTGGTHTAAVDDSTALDAADLGAWGPDVHRFQPGGSNQIIYGGAQTGNTAAHCLAVAIRGGTGGESVDLGLRDASTGTVQNLETIACTTSYQVVTVENATPSDTDMQWCLDCDAGDDIYFVAAQLEEGIVPTTIMPNSATAAAFVRPQDVLDLSETPNDDQGSIELTVIPQDWGGTEAGTPTILTRATGAPALLYVDGSGYWASDLDGTTTLSSGVTPVDGTSHIIRLRWGAGVMSIDVDGTRVSAAYDGALDGSGLWRLATDAPVRIKNLKTYRNGDG